MTKCPGCFIPLPQTRYAWLCVSGRCKRVEDQIASRFSATPVANAPWAVQDVPAGQHPPRHLQCPQCREPMAPACPNCHERLLTDWRDPDVHVTCIAMNGARATGKSVYVAVVVKELKELAVKLGSAFAFGDDRTRDLYTEVYEKPLYVERGLMAPTPASNTSNSYQRHPLVFSIGRINGRRRYLVIRDVAGEEMERPPARTGHLQFLAHADAILFMFDPLAVPNIREKLIDLIPAQLQSGGDPMIVLQNLLRLVGPNCPPVGLILSKFDAVHALRGVDDVEWSSIMSNAGAAMLRDPSEETVTYDETDGVLLHEEVKSLMHRMGGVSLVNMLENPHSGRPIRHRFFAVSVLGESPDGRRVNARGIASFRCLDPMKWVLADRGVLRKIGA